MRWIFITLVFASFVAQSEVIPFPSPSSLDFTQVTVTDLEGKKVALPKTGTIVFIEAASKCPIMRRLLPTIEDLAKNYSGKAVFYLINSAAHDTRKTASVEATLLNTKIPTLMDSTQKFARAAGFTMSTQAVVVKAETQEILYRGAVDDSYSYDGRKDPQHHYLKDAVDAALAGQVPAVRTARAYGCAITFK